MNRLFAALFAVCCGLGAAVHGHAQTEPVWNVTGSGRQNYRANGSGRLVGGEGATVTLSADRASPGTFGAAVAVLDATPYRGHELGLSAVLATRDAAAGAGIWLRADDSAGKAVAFANSMLAPVSGTTSNVSREVRIAVPTAAAHLVLGTILTGNGGVTARHLRLAVAPMSRITTDPEAVLDAAIRIVREHALRAHNVDWTQVEPSLHAMIRGAKVPADVYPAIRLLLTKLGDHHSFLMEPWLAGQERRAGNPTSSFVVKPLVGGIGYISMPGYVGMNVQARHAFASGMMSAMAGIAPQARCGWVVDLRQDTMLAGLHPLLGERPLGSFRDAGGRKRPFTVPDAGTPLPDAPALEHAPVAVLLGPHTASSGEAVAVAFRGRPDTRSFGEPTAGLSTANAGFGLPDGSEIFLTTAVDIDRMGHAYGGKLKPDVMVSITAAGGHDATLAAALAWLGRRGCNG
jgi:hypothetical protein